jgi:hypothetical protein
MKLLHLSFIILFVSALGVPAGACCPPVLLTIDDNNPCDVVITATGAFAALCDSSTTEGDGIDLLHFFPNAVPETDPISCSTLTPSGNCTVPYNDWFTDDASGCRVDLNLFTDGSDATQEFSRCVAAFLGSFTIDLSSFDGNLPCLNDEGCIMVGYSSSEEGSGAIIGRWVVVPESSSYGFLATLALAGTVISRKLFLNRNRPPVAKV